MHNLNIIFAMISVLIALGVFVAFTLGMFWRFRRRGRFSPFTEGVLRMPGRTVRNQWMDAATDYTNFCLLIMGSSLLIGFGLFLAEIHYQFFSVSTGIAGAVFCLYKLNQLFNRIQNLKLGTDGEEYTGQELNLLMLDGARVYHDVPYQYGNIDHVVVGFDKAFTIETKSIRKPHNANGSESSRLAKITYTGEKLIFPHNYSSDEALVQTQRHAKYLGEAIKQACGIDFPVKPVVALPGWMIENTYDSQPEVLVINPKRGMFLRQKLGKKTQNENREKVIDYLDSIARSECLRNNRTDPDAEKFHDFWLNRKTSSLRRFGEN